MDRVTWTPTEQEQRAYVEAAALRAWRRGLIPLAIFATSAAVLWSSGGLLVPLLVVLTALGGAVLTLLLAWYRVGRVVGRSYPVGRTAVSEALESSWRVTTVVAVVEVPWERYAHVRTAAATVLVRDAVTRRHVMLPRQLIPDEWLPRFGAGAES